MSGFQIRKVRKDEFETLMNLMNHAFSFAEEKDRFEHILPKLYFKENKEMVHYAVFVNDEMVASIGLYTMYFQSRY